MSTSLGKKYPRWVWVLRYPVWSRIKIIWIDVRMMQFRAAWRNFTS